MKKFEWKVDVKNCKLDEINRELKRLASLKCRKCGKEKEFYAKKYVELVEIKNERFGGKVIKKVNYMGMSVEEVESLSMEKLEDGLNVLYSMRCYYKGRKDKSEKVEKMFKVFKDEKERRKNKEEYERLKEMFG